MLATQNLDKLLALRLEGMAQALQEQRRQHDITDLDFEERMGLLIERQWIWKENRGLAVRLKYAHFKIECALEDIDYQLPRGLKRAQIEQLRATPWVEENRSCLITGATGTGKTFLGCALGHQACRQGHRALYYYAPKFFRALQIAHVDGSLLQLLKKLARVSLLVIDDLGIASVTAKQYRDLLEVLDDRHGQGATLITSQLPVEEWHQIIGDATVADAIMDRVAHNDYRIKLEGESVRKLKARERSKTNPSGKKRSGSS
jgi:DNA replication protein DnaC